MRVRVHMCERECMRGIRRSSRSVHCIASIISSRTMMMMLLLLSCLFLIAAISQAMIHTARSACSIANSTGFIVFSILMIRTFEIFFDCFREK